MCVCVFTHVHSQGQSHRAPGLGLPLITEADLCSGISVGLGMNCLLDSLGPLPSSLLPWEIIALCWYQASIGRPCLPLDLNPAETPGDIIPRSSQPTAGTSAMGKDELGWTT